MDGGGGKKLAKKATTAVDKLISVVEIIKREYSLAVQEAKAARATQGDAAGKNGAPGEGGDEVEDIQATSEGKVAA